MPLPMPYHDGDYENCDRQESSLRRALNLAVMNLNWLHLGCPAKPPASYNPSGTMSSSQLQVLSHLRMCFLDWSQAAPITADSMGRSAGKVETLEDCLTGLEREAHRLKVLLGSGRSPAPTTSASRPPEVQAKDIEAHRIKFAGSPSFDPSALLPPVTRTWYQSPLECAMPESEYLDQLPHVQVRGQRREVIKLLRALDSTGRLKIFHPSEVRHQVKSGMFAIMKSLEVDRMIMDCRPANCLENPLSEYTQCMAAACPILDIILRPSNVMLAAGEDLKDFYYYFRVTKERAVRNTLAFELSATEARTFKCCPVDVDDSSVYYPALGTMAMGDLNAVEYGQASHTLLALQRGLRFDDLLVMRGRPPRQDVAVGLVIDDLIIVEQVPSADPKSRMSSAIADDMVSAYEGAGLVANSKKRFREQLRANFWGMLLDGQTGLVRAQLERVIPAAVLTARMARFGYGDRKLLETVAGMWTAILQLRRPCMCLLEAFFDQIQLHDYGEPFALPPELIAECWTLTSLAPLFCSGLRAAVHPELALVDASDAMEAEVVATVGQKLAEELARQRLTRAAWAKLLSPLQALRVCLKTRFLRKRNLLVVIHCGLVLFKALIFNWCESGRSKDVCIST